MNYSQPYKSVAAALMFSVLLGPIGLLYASFWGGVLMVFLAIIVLSAKFIFLAILLWVICCIWGVGAVESYNKRIYQASNEKRNSPA
jgi:archaellum component FlaF (FlaF/FlaG flagellin family)